MDEGVNMDRNDVNDFPYFEDAHESDYKSERPRMQSTHMSQIRFESSSSPRDYRNVLVYEPKKCSDVQTLIDYLKRKEPAIINLDGTDPSTAQRILDFAAGAMYALNGSVLRISGNIFLLSPEGVGVTVPHEMDKK